MSRWPLVLLVVALLAAGMAYDRVELVETAAPQEPVVADVNPVLFDPPRLSSAWYCPIGSAVGGYAEHSVEVVNVGADAAVATVSMLTDTGPGPSIRMDIGAGGRRTVALAELGAAPAAGAVVEVLDGQGIVNHRVATPHGPAVGSCATGGSEQWHFAGGVTTRDATFVIALLNPFAEDAVFDVRFEATGRARTPAPLQGAIVPAGSVQVIDVTQYVAREAAVSTTITLRRGQVVAERLQSFDGLLGPVGSALQLGAPSGTSEAWYPAGRVHAGGDQRVVLYNPNDTAAEVDVSFLPFDRDLTASFGLVPLEVSVAPGRFEVIDLVATANRLGLPLPFDTGLHVLSVNGVPVVAERWSLAPPVDPTIIGAGGDQLPDAPAPDAGGPAELPDPAEQAGPDGASGIEPVVLAGPGQRRRSNPAAASPLVVGRTVPPAGSGPPAQVPVDPDAPPPDGGEDAEVPVEQVEPPPPPPQATPTGGVAIDRGVVRAAERWVVPAVSMFEAEGTTLVVVGVEGSSNVVVRSVAGGEAVPALATFDVEAGQRVAIPLTGTEPVSDLLVRSTGPIVAAVSLVDPDGRLDVRNAIPILPRDGS